ncbi:hypothetical protein D3C81_2328340 [compost metagenome]
MEASYYVRFNELIDKYAKDSLSDMEKQEYNRKCHEILDEKIMVNEEKGTSKR